MTAGRWAAKKAVKSDLMLVVRMAVEKELIVVEKWVEVKVHLKVVAMAEPMVESSVDE